MLLGITAVLVAILAGIVFLLVSQDLSLSDETKYAELQRLHASAGVYHTRLGFFDGVCEDIGATKPFVCNETEGAFAIAVSMKNGDMHCADSTGFIGEVKERLGTKVACK